VNRETYVSWVNEGSPRDNNNSVPHDIKMFYVNRTLNDFGLRSFVESGTSFGDGVAAVLPNVDLVHTIEAWDHAYQFSSNRFKGNDNVVLHFGDSAELLPGILAGIGPSVFWLDAHYSGDGTAQLEKDTPIVAELEAIAASKDASFHCIVIDDARGFGVWKDYPTVEEMKELCHKLFPTHDFFLEGDEIFVLPC